MKPSNSEIRVRLAPSPTGYMHIGTLRMALTDYLFARKNKGTFVLRVEDTDRKRYVEGAVENMAKVLSVFGLTPDEGVLWENDMLAEKGGYGPYTQSERLPIYRQCVDELLAKKKAYHCFCSPERLVEVRAEQARNKQAPKYDRHCRTLSDEDVRKNIEAGQPYVIRMIVPDDREVSFVDLVRGEIRFHTRDVDDQVLLKSDGFPTYHLAVVVDDHLMNISHVIRGEEWLSSTPKHLLLYEAFGWEPTLYAHLPLLLNADRSKLSKRQGDVAVEDYLAKGYLPEALINFVALLGWNPGEGNTQEIFSLDELVERFDFSGVHKAGAVFDLGKLDWMNGEYIKRLSVDELFNRSVPFFEGHHEEAFMKRVVTVEQERLTRLSDIGKENPFFFSAPACDASMLPWKKSTPEGAGEALERAEELLTNTPDADWTREKLGELLLSAAGDDRGGFLWPLRVALTGAEKSPPPQDIAWVIGKETTLSRIRSALDVLGGSTSK